MARSSKNPKRDQSIIFLHIPKAAGTTLNRIMERQFEPTAIFTIDGSRTQESIEEFKKLPKAQREKIRVLRGHMHFGLHEHLPQPSTYITILRDPVDRTISNYYFVLRNPNHRLHYEVKSRHMTLKDYVSSRVNPQLDNGQTRLLSGVEGRAFGECSTEMLEIAKKNLEEFFSIVGLVERFDETLILLKRAFGWRIPFYIKENITRSRPIKGDILKLTLNLIEEYNELDIDLYRYATEMFEELLNQQTSSYERELKAFKLLNRLYVKVYPFLRPRYKM
jgi:hypothetical protein